MLFEVDIENQNLLLKQFLNESFEVTNSESDVIDKTIVWSLASKRFSLSDSEKGQFMTLIGRAVFGQGDFSCVKSVGKRRRLICGLKLVKENETNPEREEIEKPTNNEDTIFRNEEASTDGNEFDYAYDSEIHGGDDKTENGIDKRKNNEVDADNINLATISRDDCSDSESGVSCGHSDNFCDDDNIIDFESNDARVLDKAKSTLTTHTNIISPQFRKEQLEGTNFVPEVYFGNSNWNNIQTLSARSYPGKIVPTATTVKEVLDDTFRNLPDSFQKDICSTGIYRRNQVRGFITFAFPPVATQSVAAAYIGGSLKVGTPYPQFVNKLSQKMFTIDCAVCLHYQKWSLEKCLPHPKLKAKTATDSLILKGQSSLAFEGMRQVYEHYVSKAHQRAIQWFSGAAAFNAPQKEVNKVPNAKSGAISDFFKKSSKKLSQVPCLHVWDPAIADNFKKDSAIRRIQPKTLFKERMLSTRKTSVCHEAGHKNCGSYNGWSKNHPEEAKKLEEESKNIVRSVYVPHNKTIEIGGRTVTVEGGVKSLDPCCLGTALPVGENQYTCSNCLKQKPYLENLLAKRAKASYSNLDGGRYGMVGFRHDYMKKNEQEDALSRERIGRINAEKETLRLRRVILTTKTWEEMLWNSCEAHEEQKLVTDLMLLFERNVSRTNPLQITVMRNLVGKLKSKNNHRFVDIVKDISGMYKNKLGKLNYSLLEDIFGLPSSSSATTYIKSQGKLKPGLNWEIIDKAIEEYDDGPVSECSDEARTLRYLEPRVSEDGQLELIGCSWDPQVQNWPLKVPVPRRDILSGDPDDFSALKRLISNIIDNGALAHGTNIHNFSGLATSKASHLVHCVWPMSSKGFTAPHLIAFWKELLKMARHQKDGSVRARPLKLIGFSTDSAGHQLSAAVTLMTPSAENVKAGIPCLGLGISDERFLAPYFWEFPTIAYLDYLHERRLFLKNLKYTTRELVLGEDGVNSAFATIAHLQELKETCGAKGVDCGLKQSDLLLIHFMDQNQDACNAVFTLKTSELLDQYVPGSQGTSLYIQAVYYMTEPFHNPKYGSPADIQEAVSTGITILRLWKKSVEICKKLRINAKSGAANDPSKRGNFLTYGCYLTAEVHFAAATNHCLMMFLHFYKLGDRNCSPHFSGTKATERIIAELQGKTNQIQCLDAQPTYGDIVERISNVQFNQAAQKRICLSGGKVTASSNHKKTLWDFTLDTESSSTYKYPSLYSEFLSQQRQAHYRGVKRGQNLYKRYAPEKVVSQLLKTNSWETPYKFNKPDGIVIINSLNDLPYDHDRLGFMCSKTIVPVEPDLEEQECRKNEFMEGDENEDASFQVPELDESLEEKNIWYISKEESPGVLSKMHVKRAISLLLPREYISRERSRRHWVPKYLSGITPPEEDHNLIQFRDVAYKSNDDISIGRVIMIHCKAKGKSITSAKSSASDVIFRCRVYDDLGSNNYEVPKVAKISPWKAASSFICEVFLEKGSEGLFHLSHESCSRLDQLKERGQHVTQLDARESPLEPDMYEVSDIIDRRLVKATQTYEYKVRFKGYGPEDDVWLPSAAFNQTVQFESTSQFGRKRKHQTAMDNEVDPFSTQFVAPQTKKKKPTTTKASSKRKFSEMCNEATRKKTMANAKSVSPLNANEVLMQSARSKRSNFPANLRRGMVNLGTTCWISAVVQFVAETRIGSILSSHQSNTNANVITRQMGSFIDKLKEKSTSPVNPTPLKLAVQNTGSSLDTRQQNDVLEFLSFLSNSCIVNGVKIFQNSVIGDIINKWTCLQCNKESFHVSQFTEFIGEVDSPGCLVEECIKNALKDEILSGNNAKYCEQCGSNTDTNASTRLLRNPDVLIVALKRFNLNPKSSLVKTSDPICIQRAITLNKFMYTTGSPKSIRYYLRGVIVHKGTSIESGHYYTVCPPCDISSNRDVLYDDALVQEKIDHIAAMDVQKNCYILCYETNTDDKGHVPLLKCTSFSCHPCCKMDIPSQVPVLTQAQNHEVDVALSAKDSQFVTKVGNYRVIGKDMKTLEGTNWLNDEIINAYLSLLLLKYKNLINAMRLESHFYTKLCQHGYEGVKNWTKRVEVFSKELILIPVNYKTEKHWTLVVIDIPGKTFYHFDPLNGDSNGTECLNEIWVWMLKEAQQNGKDIEMEKWSFSFPIPNKEIPKQTNGHDCGVFVCMLARCIVCKNPMNFTQNDMQGLRMQIAYELLKNELSNL